jgi:hypothetical protein
VAKATGCSVLILCNNTASKQWWQWQVSVDAAWLLQPPPQSSGVGDSCQKVEAGERDNEAKNPGQLTGNSLLAAAQV